MKTAQSNKSISSINEASQLAAQLSTLAQANLSEGRSITIHRLNWLEFESLWSELSALLTALLAADEKSGPEQILEQLSSAPAFVLKLAGLAARIEEVELAKWNFDDVLLLCAAALEMNFVEGAGLRSFFTAVGKLAGEGA
jgi:hypothetical protein